MGYSLDFRKKVFEIQEKERLTFEETSKRFGIGKASLVRWKKNIEPQKRRNKPATKIDMDALRKDVEKYPEAYQYERAKRFAVTASSIWYALKRLGVTYKKNPETSQGGPGKAQYILPKNK
jgi:transposase